MSFVCEIFNTKADFVRKGDSSVKTDKADQRTRITKKMIREAFLTLLSGKDIRHITVRELCERAQINRGTFYKYYLDVYDLKEQIENELLIEFGGVGFRFGGVPDGIRLAERKFRAVYDSARAGCRQRHHR